MYVKKQTSDIMETRLNFTEDTRRKESQISSMDKDDLDDTGYETLQLKGDTFFDKIGLIKKHLEREDHPLNQFISCFDQEFSDYYLVFLSNDGSTSSKTLA